jgi:hypothetical protein
MIKLLKSKALWRINIYPFFLFLSFLIWCFSFRDFLTGKVALSSDALAYYEHFKFFSDQLSRGVYPLWDPTVFCGIPFEFYARRIGSFNPMYSLILIFKEIIPDLQAYLAFLATYFFIGMIGYFKLVSLVLGDKRFALLAYVLLMFSSLGTRLFDSYILLTFIPMVWFFYFLAAFSMQGKKHQFLGMLLTTMILFTTYLPFYFITVLISFILFYAVFYLKPFITQIMIWFRFIKQHKIFVLICVLFFAVSLLPGIELFKQAQNGEFVLAYRHSTLQTQNTIEVDPEWKKWSGMEDIAYSFYFSNLKKFNFAIIYLPVFCYLIFMLGIIIKLNRKLLFLFCWGGFIFLLSSPNVTGTYNFLSSHFSYFKYFRNLHFFLWMVVIPVTTLFFSEQLRSFINFNPRNNLERTLLTVFILVVHCFGLWFFVTNGQNILSTYLVFGMSLLFFLLHFFGKINLKKTAFLMFIIMMNVSQSVEVFKYLGNNVPQGGYSYRYQSDDYLHPKMRSNKVSELFYPEVKFSGPISYEYLSESIKNPEKIYLDAKWVSYLYKNLNKDIFEPYLTHGFLIYDRINWLGKEKVDLEKLGKSFLQYENLAHVSSSNPPTNLGETSGNLEPRYEIVSQESSNVKLVKFDVNSVQLSTDFSHPRFLVYNDSYYDGWQAFINGKKTDLYRTNVAFKGLWVPAGKNVVEFRFGYPWQYVLNYGLLMLFYGILIALIYLWIKDIHYLQSMKRLMHKWIKIGS